MIIDEDGLGGVVVNGATIAGTAEYGAYGQWTLVGKPLMLAGNEIYS